MKFDGLGKHLLIAFGAALAFYLGAYALDSYLRTRHGPWRVTFTSAGTNAPAILINAPRLGITNVQLVFPGEQAPAGTNTVAFDAPAKTVPFGERIYDDLMILPGAVTLNLFGHGVELLPRTLIVNQRQLAWQSGATIELKPAEKPPVKPAPVPSRR